MASVNKVILIANFGRDPELKQIQNGTSLCNVSLATSRRYKDSQGQSQEETEWHRVAFFGRTAEVVCQYCHKGDSIYVEGHLQTREYTDRDGVRRFSTSIICESMQLLGKRETPQRSQAAAPAARPAPQRAPAPASGIDDDVPF